MRTRDGCLFHTTGVPLSSFFPNTINVSYQMNGSGFHVACSAPGAGGKAQLGNAYDCTIQAQDSDDLNAKNVGTTYCPPFKP